jgi:hypothetical protein
MWAVAPKGGKMGISYKALHYTVEGLSAETVFINELVVYFVTLSVSTLYSSEW